MYAIIVNPSSGRGKAVQRFQQIEQKFLASAIRYETLLSDSKEASHLFVQQLMESNRLTAIIVIGGDGTTGSVVQLASEQGIPLAILPAGSGNDAARTFKLTPDPSIFIEKLQNPTFHPVDLLDVNGQLGITIAAAGVDAEIGEKANHSLYKRLLNKVNLGGVAYPIAAIHTLLVFSPFEIGLSVDGKPFNWNRTWLIAAGNTPSYGGGLKVCPEALTNDGLMNLTVVHSASRKSLLLSLFPKLIQGNPIRSASITYLTCSSVSIKTDRSVLLILDGEPIESPSFTIRILPSALKLVNTSE
ncbi:diacylglycerol/lipid kinase family protein [Sporosarcina sp. A2]|uniref:diacylglycerol/lipid kinase family protein n=1 Tax=Sporosarcina sp. A2 TaxID=3393449 RepID=UPI003D7BF394